MKYQILVLFAFAATSFASFLPKPSLEGRSDNSNLGCVSYQGPSAGLPAQQSVTFREKDGGLPVSAQDTMISCLNAYGCGDFANSWNGNICGGRGWFKGTSNDKISADYCYEILAPWIIKQGILAGSSDFQADFRKGVKGHCWMGYNDPGTTV